MSECAVIEDLIQYDLTRDEAATLVRMGLIVEFDDPEATDLYVLTALLWHDLELDADKAYKLFDSILGREAA